MKNKANKKNYKKDSAMFLTIICIWFPIGLYFYNEIFKYLKWEEPKWTIFSVIIYIICINIFWIIGFYQALIPIFSKISEKFFPLQCGKLKNAPAVAVLYLTMNDFNETAVRSCINQDYSNFKVFILDDSTDKKIKTKIDNFVKKNKNVTLIRRNNRLNFKAGNLNNALSNIHKHFPYFVVSDADGILPSNFISKLLPYFSIDESIGFVQSQQRINTLQKFSFAKYLKYYCDLHFKYYLPAKNRYGFVMFYGHGAIIKTKMWELIGGFPNSVTEDLVFSSEIAKLGYKGIYVKDVICYEDFPEDYRKYRKRSRRWIQGTVDYFIRWFPSALFSKNILWFEKLDIIISAGRLLFAIPFLIYLILICFVLPFASKSTSLHISILPVYIPLKETIEMYFVGKKNYLTWHLGFFIVMTIYGLSESFVAFMEWYKKPIKLFNYMAQYTFISLSTILYFSLNPIFFLFYKKKKFYVSGIKVYEGKNIKYRIPLKLTLFNYFEAIVGIFLLWNVFITSNIWLIPIGIALIGNMIAYKFRWETPLVHIIINLPFIIVILILFILGLSFI